MKTALFIVMVFSMIGFVLSIAIGKSRESIVIGACFWGVAYCCKNGIIAIWDQEAVKQRD